MIARSTVCKTVGELKVALRQIPDDCLLFNCRAGLMHRDDPVAHKRFSSEVVISWREGEDPVVEVE